MSRLQAIAAWVLGSLLALLLYMRWVLGLALAIALLGCAARQPEKAQSVQFVLSIPVTPECVKKIVCSAPDCKKAKITRLKTSACEVWERAEEQSK